MDKVIKLKIICLNLWLGGLLFEEILQFLRDENPDIVLLQEVYNSDDLSLKRNFRSFSILRDELNFAYSHFAPAFLEIIESSQLVNDLSIGTPIANVPNQKIMQGNAILSKFPIIDQSIKFYDIPFGNRIDEFAYYSVTPRNLQHVLLDLNSSDKEAGGQALLDGKNISVVSGQKLHVFNTQGIWGTHGNDTDRRLKMGDFIVNEVSRSLQSEKSSVFLAGDFNLNPNTKTVKKIENILESVFKSNLKTSFNLKRKNLEKDPGYATSAVDMMFVSSDIKVLTKSCSNVDISDHLPLEVELEVS